MKTLVIVVMLMVAGCGGSLTQPTEVAGDWAYAWQLRPDVTVHGMMTLAQDGDAVSGALMFPSDFPDYTARDVADWQWIVNGAADGGAVDLTATDPGFNPWIFRCVVDDDGMVGPSFGADGTPEYTFSATRL